MKPRKYLLLLLLIPMLFLNGCIIKMYEEYQDSHRKPTTTAPTEETTTEAPRLEGEIFGVIAKVDLGNKVITIRDIETNALLAYFYTGYTDIRDKYGEIMAAGVLQPGDIVEGTYYVDDSILNTLSISSKAWSNLRVHNWAYDGDTNRIRIGTQTYSLYDYCIVVQDGKIIDIRELASIDELVVRGYENTVYSINVLKGHGYISLENEDFFIGGIVTVGNEVGLEITDDMLIMAEEGKHILSVTKSGVGGAVEITVQRGKEIFVDVGPLQGEAVMHGSVYFTITPENAKLIIDGKVQNHEDLVELPFGTYRIAVEAVGYVPYMGDLVVGDTFIRKTISLGLEEKSTEVTEPDEDETTIDPEETTSASEETQSDNSGEIADTTTADGEGTEKETTTGNEETLPLEEETTVIHTGEKDVSKYKIHIESPVGAEVYFDSEYVGIAPLEFEKQSGLHTIIFKRDGYQMKAYVMEISAEACDEHYSFLPLEKTEE